MKYFKLTTYFNFFCVILIIVIGKNYWTYINSPISLIDFKHGRKELKYASGAWDDEYLLSNKKLHRQRLNLNEWGGFHHLYLDKGIPTQNLNISFDFHLSPDSYLYFFLDQSNLSSIKSIRLSRNSLYPPAYLEIDNFGAFLKKEALPALSLKEINRLRVHYNNHKTQIFINNRLLFEKEAIDSSFVQVGFMGSDEKTPVWVDNLLVPGKKYSFNFYESYNSFNEDLLIVFTLIVLTLVCFKYIKDKISLLILSSSLNLLSLTSILFVYLSLPSLISIPKGKLVLPQHVEERLLKTLSNTSASKVAFFGGSKTLGLGAIPIEKNWVNTIIERFSLDAKNFAEIAANSTHLLETLKKLKRYPHYLILHSGVNDLNKELFKKNLIEFREIAKLNNFKIIFIEEFTYLNKLEELPFSYSHQNYQYVKNLCDEKTMYCIQLSESFFESSAYDSGLLWSEWVHFSTFGQEVFANLISKELKRLLN